MRAAQVAATHTGDISAREDERLSYRDAADCLNIPIGTVRSRIARAVELMQQSFPEYAVCDREMDFDEV
jgi:DNA-directed RNA polymerase specialized sigma24 family protein